MPDLVSQPIMWWFLSLNRPERERWNYLVPGCLCCTCDSTLHAVRVSLCSVFCLRYHLGELLIFAVIEWELRTTLLSGALARHSIRTEVLQSRQIKCENIEGKLVDQVCCLLNLFVFLDTSKG